MTKFRDCLQERRAWYKTIKKIYCPILNEEVVFNSKGFYHLRYDSFGKARTVKEQHYKIGLLPLAIPVIKKATKVHKYNKEQYSKPLGKYYENWELREVVGKQKIMVSVIIRRIGKGKIFFLSIMKRRDKSLRPKKSKKPSD